jgi:hydroxymethylpyrimidine/phosphomethylpyrimidine kinase
MDRGDAARVSWRTPIALTIAGSDSGGGAGIQADLKTFAALGVHGASAITALTAQNTRGVHAIHVVPADIVAAQIGAVIEDFNVAAIKIGMLGSAAIAEAVCSSLLPRGEGGAERRMRGRAVTRADAGGGWRGPSPPTPLPKGEGRAFVVYDPVMAASSGDALAGAGFVAAVRAKLLRRVDCLTPNLAEAAALLDEPLAGSEQDMERQGTALLALGPRAVLMKGGHLQGADAVDLLITADGVRRFSSARLAGRNTHGTGCTLSSAIAAFVTAGAPLGDAVAAAKAFVTMAIERGAGVELGEGPGPVLQAPLHPTSCVRSGEG